MKSSEKLWGTGRARELGFSKAKYEAAVLKLLQEERDALEWCRGLFGELLSEIDGN